MYEPEEEVMLQQDLKGKVGCSIWLTSIKSPTEN